MATGSCVSVLTKRVVTITHLVDLAVQEQVAREGGDRPRLGERRRVAVGELGDELPPAAATNCAAFRPAVMKTVDSPDTARPAETRWC